MIEINVCICWNASLSRSLGTWNIFIPFLLLFPNGTIEEAKFMMRKWCTANTRESNITMIDHLQIIIIQSVQSFWCARIIWLFAFNNTIFFVASLYHSLAGRLTGTLNNFIFVLVLNEHYSRHLNMETRCVRTCRK